MNVFRVCHPKHQDTVLSGMGAEKVGGRWNEVGTRAVYCSESVALALLEYYVHSDNVALLPKAITVACIEIPDYFRIDELPSLPPEWNKYPYSGETARIFTQRCKSPDFLGLRVPSAVVPPESNLILNPLYKEFGRITVKEFITLPVDKRLKATKS